MKLESIKVGEVKPGLLEARWGEWRVVSWVEEGEHTVNRWIGGRLGWVLLGEDEPDQIPVAVERALCAALGLGVDGRKRHCRMVEGVAIQ